MRGSANPGALAEADLDRVRDLLGDDAARSLERLAELARMLEEAGLIENREGRLELTPKGIRRVGAERPVRPVLQAGQGQDGPAPDHPAPASATSGATRASRTSSATRSTSTCTAPSATPCAARGRARPVRPRPGRLRDRADREHHPLVDRAHARPLAVDADAGQLPVRQEGGHGAALADQQPVPARLPRHRRLQRGGSRPEARAAARR